MTHPAASVPHPEAALRALAARWAAAPTARGPERANAQSYLIELCAALGVEPPRPAGSGYEFGLPIRVTNRDGSESRNLADCYKRGHFVLEAKSSEPRQPTEILLRRAYGQARTCANHDPDGVAPAYVLVLDVGRTLLVWDRWGGSFGAFATGRRIDVATLADRPDDVALLRDVWTDPARPADPRPGRHHRDRRQARRPRRLDTLATLGELRVGDDGRYAAPVGAY